MTRSVNCLIYNWRMRLYRFCNRWKRKTSDRTTAKEVSYANRARLQSISNQMKIVNCQVSSTCCAFAVMWGDGTITTKGISEGGGNCEHVFNLLSSVRMLRANTSSFAALSSHYHIVCWWPSEWRSHGGRTSRWGGGHSKHQFGFCCPLSRWLGMVLGIAPLWWRWAWPSAPQREYPTHNRRSLRSSPP